ncbi:MAG: 5-formyltetrahydrofolate cyclo-ligase [Desulfobulbaceae bacterium]|uniref:5-formyltetrahydrofolate cyclo-ligase n=1 Tax=Candidatus Desulfatifera sulfidica TaxID=2841691 RepID=A0A8J6T9D2_9BACT|nr:5-formyltetrahydrofolate cyclo-ligase [Candidatus Desulfatifera sulfidica]
MINTPDPRQETLALRDQLSPEERSFKSDLILERFWDLPEIARCRSFLVYVDFRSEVRTWDLLTQLLLLGRIVAVPLTRVLEKKIIPIQVTDPVKELTPGYCGIPEPRSAVSERSRLDPTLVDVVIVPGSVFDQQGGRMGYGGGYYDRFLAHEAPQALRVGLAYDLQIIPQLELAPHDQTLDLVITESRVITGRRLRTEKDTG